MGVGQSAVEQLAVYCVSLKKCVLWPLRPGPGAEPRRPSRASPPAAPLPQGRAGRVEGQALEPCCLGSNPGPPSNREARADF